MILKHVPDKTDTESMNIKYWGLKINMQKFKFLINAHLVNTTLEIIQRAERADSLGMAGGLG